MKIECEEINRVCGLEPGTILIRGLWIEPGALGRLPEVMAEEGWMEPVIICDQNTYGFGEDLLDKFEDYHLICLDPEGLAADERSVSLAQNKIPETADCMIALGSVTIHDITRYLCWQYRLPFLSVPTAASGEGYTTDISAIIRKGMKQDVRAVAPDYLFADTEIFAKAPKRLTAAGFSDLIGNYIAMADWQIGAVLTGEPVNMALVAEEKRRMDEIVHSVSLLADGDAQMCEKLLYALILPDLAIGRSVGIRPMMGAEHHLSRYLDISWEKQMSDAVHGEKVGVMTLICLGLYEEFREALERKQLEPKDIRGRMRKEIKKGFENSDICENIYRMNEMNEKTEISGKMLMEQSRAILTILEALPSAEVIEEACRKMGCKTQKEEIGVDEQQMMRALRYAPYVSADITLLRLRKLVNFFG